MVRFFVSSLYLVLLMTITTSAFGASDSSQLIAPIEDALTLAQIEYKQRIHTILVIKEEGEQMEGIDLSEHYKSVPPNPLDLVAEVGAASIRTIYKERKDLRKTFDKRHFIVSPGLSSAHVAAGTNYSAHGEEAGIDSTFLFPKFAQPSRFDAAVLTSPAMLLDYEVELCATFHHDISSLEEFNQAVKGFFLCGDFTDRALLLRNINVDDVASGRGFTDAKSGNNRFPVGLYVVVPRDWSDFVNSVNLTLKVNGELRQNASASKMLKKLDGLVQMSLKEANDTNRWIYQGKPAFLMDGQVIRKGQSILTGTPEGVVVRAPSLSYKIMKGTQWFFTLSFLDESPVDYVLEQYIEESFEKRIFLQAGDVVEMQGTFLGNTRHLIVDRS